MCLPFVQLDVEEFYQVQNSFMGIVGACSYITIGLGYFYLVFKPIKEALPRYLINMGIAGSAYLLIFLFILLKIKVPFFLVAFLMIAGFAQAAAYPVVVRLIYQYFTPKGDGILIGLWTACGDAGNIFSFLINTLMVYEFHWPWPVCILVAGLLTILMAVVLRTTLEEKEEEVRELFTGEVISLLKNFFSSWYNIILLCVICLLKGTLYGILLWMPIYFEKAGFKEFEGFIPMSFSISTILGSTLAGSMYKCLANKIRSLITVLSFILMIVFLVLLKNLPLTPNNKWTFMCIISIIGFIIGGGFNSLISIESPVIARQRDIPVDFISAIMMTGSCIVVGIVQLIIGLSTTKSKFASITDEDSIFLIFIIFGALALILEIGRTILAFCIHQ